MSKLYSNLFLLLLIAFLSLNKSYCQPCLICFGGSSDGYANTTLASCSAPATIFAGGSNSGATLGLNGTCSSATLAFAAGGSHSGFSADALGSCAVPASIVAGGTHDGASNASISICSSPTTILKGGDNSGASSDAISPCAPPATLLVGGSFDGFSGAVVSICAPPVSLIQGGEHSGSAEAFTDCVPLAISDADNAEPFANLYPNPASNAFTVSLTGYIKAGTITIYDVLGKEIATQLIYPAKERYSFKSKDWAEGAYMIKIAFNGTQFNKQLMVIK